MRSPSIPSDETHRLEALHSLGLLDTLPEPRFDRLTYLACCLANVPTAVISFVDGYRQWFKSRQGLKVSETSRDISFCGHAILQSEALIVPDALEDARFADNPLVTDAPYVRFYAGNPIRAPGGARVGTFAVIDSRPRTLSSREFSALATLATMRCDKRQFTVIATTSMRDNFAAWSSRVASEISFKSTGSRRPPTCARICCALIMSRKCWLAIVGQSSNWRYV